LEATLNQSFAPLDSLLFTVVLATLAVGLPILVVLSTRFLWDRRLNLGRSKELEKLIWQLHRIASAMEHQMNLSFPAVQPGTEEPRDLAYLQNPPQPTAAAPRVAAASAAAVPAPMPAVQQPAAQQAAVQQPAPQQPVAPAPHAEEESLPALERRDPSVQVPRAGVNSMFGL
jgi:outer membrane biosynthesis protein TonB